LGKYKFATLALLVMIFIIVFAVVGGIYRGIVEPGIDEHVPDGNFGIACQLAGLNCPEEWSSTATPIVVPSPTSAPLWP